jgi:release factor glutamine methyltransferase
LELLNWSTHYLEGHHIDNPRLNAELLLARSQKLTKERLYIHLKNQIKERERAMFEEMIERRVLGEPLQYILGHQEFWSIDLKVDPRVFIPRPETEFLVEQSLFILSEIPFVRTPYVLEIGTGSGAVSIALAKEMRNIFLVATDISRDALFLAKENARDAGVLHKIKFINGHLFAPFRFLEKGRPFDLILSNPPYVVRSEIGRLAKEVRDHEPTIALDGGEDGLEFYRRIIAPSFFYLRRGRWLLLEVGQGQGEKVSQLIERAGHFLKAEIFSDLSGIDRVVRAKNYLTP